MSYLLITSREKFIFEPMSVIDIETTVIEFLRSESKRFDTRYAGEADGSAIGSAEDLPPRFRPNPRGNARTPPGSARIRANPRRKFFRRASSRRFDK